MCLIAPYGGMAVGRRRAAPGLCEFDSRLSTHFFLHPMHFFLLSAYFAFLRINLTCIELCLCVLLEKEAEA